MHSSAVLQLVVASFIVIQILICGVPLQELAIGTGLIPLTRLTYLSLERRQLRLSAANPELPLPPSLQHLNLQNSR